MFSFLKNIRRDKMIYQLCCEIIDMQRVVRCNGMLAALGAGENSEYPAYALAVRTMNECNFNLEKFKEEFPLKNQDKKHEELIIFGIEQLLSINNPVETAHSCCVWLTKSEIERLKKKYPRYFNYKED